MKPLICEMCGSTDVIKQNGVFVCQHCSTKYSLEDAKQMMIEGTVKIDSSGEIKNLYELARRAKDEKNDENAAKYYGLLLIKDPSSWEANFFTVYFKAMTCKVAEISTTATNVKNCIHSTFILIRDNILDIDARKQAILAVKEYAYSISDMLYYASNNHFEKIDYSIKDRYKMEYLNNVLTSQAIKAAICNELCDIFSADEAIISSIGVDILKERIASGIAVDADNRYVKIIQKYDLTYQPPENQTTEDIMRSINATTSNNSGGCYIATAIYGSYDCPQVWTLRRFRDNTLATSWYGRLFIHTYYTISPTLIKWFGHTVWFKKICHRNIDKMVSKLQQKGVPSTPYQDQEW